MLVFSFIIALDFLLNLETSGSKEFNEQAIRRNSITLNALYGTTIDGVKSLSLHELNKLLSCKSQYALFHSLVEMSRRANELVQELSLYMSDSRASRKIISSISSFRRSLSSVSILSVQGEEEDLFESDFLFKSNHFSQNREGEINQILLNAQRTESCQPSTAIKRVGFSYRNSYQSHSTLRQINEDEDVELASFNEIAKSILLLRDILTTCLNGGYGDLCHSICITCASILKEYSTNPHLCTLIWDERKTIH